MRHVEFPSDRQGAHLVCLPDIHVQTVMVWRVLSAQVGQVDNEVTVILKRYHLSIRCAMIS